MWRNFDFFGFPGQTKSTLVQILVVEGQNLSIFEFFACSGQKFPGFMISEIMISFKN